MLAFGQRAFAVAAAVMVLLLGACVPGSPAPPARPSTTSPDPVPAAAVPANTPSVTPLPGVPAPPLASVLPLLPAVSAPGWVRPGVRVSYYSAVANVLTSNERFILDEDGDWIGQTTGNRYRREELYGAAGHGVTQFDVLSVDAQAVALQVNSWQFSMYDGPLVPNGQAPWVGPASGGDWYLHPSVLAGMANRRGGGVTILRMPYTIQGVTYEALRIQQESEQATFARVYDLADGVLLASFGAVTSQQGTLFSQAIYIGVRRMDLPWLGRALPSWVSTGRTLTYTGTKSWEAIRAGTVLTAEVTLRMRIEQTNPTAFAYDRKTTTRVPGYPAQSTNETLASGLGEPTSLVLPPGALAGLRRGHVIDDDPITGIRVEVTGVGRQGGRDVVELRVRNRGYSATMTYHTDSGRMLGYSDLVVSEETRQYSDLRLSAVD